MVVKIVRKAYLFSDEERESVCREAHIHATLNHPHIVKLYDAFESGIEKLRTALDMMRTFPNHEDEELLAQAVLKVDEGARLLAAAGEAVQKSP